MSTKNTKETKNENHPHSPDVAKRATADGGFSRGWGFHFQPSEAYWLDCHNHMGNCITHPQIYRVLDEWFSQLDAYRLGRVIAIINKPEAIDACRDIARQDRRFAWIYWMPYDKPDSELMRRVLDDGAVGLKLHNSPLMRGEGSPEIWLQKEWSEVFDVVSRARSSVLWHITQRTSVSPYHGGGANSYWKDAKNGVTTSNEQLLQTTLQLARQYPNIKFVGAHQIHVGLERLAALFDEHPNLYIDTSCGFFTRWADELYAEDRDILRHFFVKYPGRILFGTDSSLAPGSADPYQVQSFLCHTRFVNQLRLTDEILQQVAHGNAEQVFGLKAMEPARRGNSRP